jgi:hypothetical protein
MEILVTNRGGKKIAYQNYIFPVNKNKGSKTFYRCKDKCGAYLILEGEQLCGVSGDHSGHGTHGDEIRKVKLKNRMKAAVLKNAEKSVPECHAVVFDSIQSDAEAGAMPSFCSVKSSLYRSRAKLLPPPPPTMAELEVPQSLRVTIHHGKPFLLGQDGVEQRILVRQQLFNLHFSHL